MHAIVEPCPSCGGFTIQPSRWRVEDLAIIFRLLRPLRCRGCGDRFYASLFASVPRASSEPKEDVIVRLRRPGIIVRALLWFIAPPSKDA